MAGEIASLEVNIPAAATIESIEDWMPYADFEREKLKELCGFIGFTPDSDFFFKNAGGAVKYNSGALTGYQFGTWYSDSESGRLLQRAEFLKAVCEKEGVDWLPTPKCQCQNPAELCFHCPPERANGTLKVGPERPEAIAYDHTMRRLFGGCICKKSLDMNCLVHGGRWCRGGKGVGHTLQLDDPTETCMVCGHVGKPVERDYYTKAEVDELLRRRW